MKTRILFGKVVILSLTVCLMMSPWIPHEAEADGKFFNKPFVGTYLIEEKSGHWDIWTLSEEGNFFGTNSGQLKESFNDQQGAWKKTGDREISATMLNFDFDSGGTLISIARADVIMTFDNKFQTVAGSYVLRYFEVGTDEDPLYPETDTEDPLMTTFTGRRVKVN